MTYQIALIVSALGLLIAIVVSLHAQHQWMKGPKRDDDKDQGAA
ncbi:hypothetical protein [Cupriavidus oxalaticus]|nr:hypothetical protein [Cupriavidus oxalaticus]